MWKIDFAKVHKTFSQHQCDTAIYLKCNNSLSTTKLQKNEYCAYMFFEWCGMFVENEELHCDIFPVVEHNTLLYA